MEKIASLLRVMQFYGHIAHNLVKGSTFFQDHEFLGDIYGAYETHYDDVVERLIGSGVKVDLFKLHASASEMLAKTTFNDTVSALSFLLKSEKTLCSVIQKEIRDEGVKMSEGTRQLLGDICNQSEIRQYKLGQRLKS